MADITGREYQERWAGQLKGSTARIRSGVEAVTIAPAKLAVAQKEKLKARLIAAIDDGTWEAGMLAVSLDDWKADMINKGIANLAVGVDNSIEKNLATAENLMRAVNEEAAKVKTMPDGNIEDSVNRAATYMRGMNKRKGSIKAR